MNEMAKVAEARQQEDTITVEYFGLPMRASDADAGTVVDLGAVEVSMAYHDEDEDEDYRQDEDDKDDLDDEDDLDDDLDEDDDEEEEEENDLDE